MSQPAASTYLAQLRELPSLPKVVLDLQIALADDDVSLEDIADIVSLDQALAAKTLKLANCSFYGVPQRVVSIRQAIGILGVRAISTLLTAAAVRERFARVECAGFDLQAYWRRSLATALCAREIARLMRHDADAAFTAGLLHDFGRLAMASQSPAALSEAYARQQATGGQLIDAERALWGTDHAELGAALAMRWHFGQVVVDAIRHHHAPLPSSAVSIIDIVHAADSIGHALDLARDPDELVPPLDPAAWNRLGLTPDACWRIFETTETELDNLSEALGAN